MTEERLIQAQQIISALTKVRELLQPWKWDGTESGERMNIKESIKVYPVGRREMMFIKPATIDKIAEMIWKDLKSAERDLTLDLEKL